MAGCSGRQLAKLGVAVIVSFALAEMAFVQAPLPKSSQQLGRRANPNSVRPWTPVAADATPKAEVAPGAWRAALAACAALLLALVPLEGAEAARFGGRMGGFGGGMRMRSSAPRMSSFPRMRSGPSIRSGPSLSLGVGPMIAPPLFGPSLFAPPLFGPPVVPVPVPHSGPSVTDELIKDQQRQDERTIDSQKQQIEALQKEVAELKAKQQ